MVSLIEKVKLLEEREKICKYIKYKQEKDYEYYKCDYCGEEIKIEKDWEKRTGGIVTLPISLTNRGKIEVAIHNQCLKKFLKELEDIKCKK